MSSEATRRQSVEDLFAAAGPPTGDEVPVAADGRRLDTPEKVIAFIDEIDATRAVKPDQF